MFYYSAAHAVTLYIPDLTPLAISIAMIIMDHTGLSADVKESFRTQFDGILDQIASVGNEPLLYDCAEKLGTLSRGAAPSYTAGGGVIYTDDTGIDRVVVPLERFGRALTDPTLTSRSSTSQLTKLKEFGSALVGQQSLGMKEFLNWDPAHQGHLIRASVAFMGGRTSNPSAFIDLPFLRTPLLSSTALLSAFNQKTITLPSQQTFLDYIDEPLLKDNLLGKLAQLNTFSSTTDPGYNQALSDIQTGIIRLNNSLLRVRISGTPHAQLRRVREVMGQPLLEFEENVSLLESIMPRGPGSSYPLVSSCGFNECCDLYFPLVERAATVGVVGYGFNTSIFDPLPAIMGRRSAPLHPWDGFLALMPASLARLANYAIDGGRPGPASAAPSAPPPLSQHGFLQNFLSGLSGAAPGTASPVPPIPRDPSAPPPSNPQAFPASAAALPPVDDLRRNIGDTFQQLLSMGGEGADKPQREIFNGENKLYLIGQYTEEKLNDRLLGKSSRAPLKVDRDTMEISAEPEEDDSNINATSYVQSSMEIENVHREYLTPEEFQSWLSSYRVHLTRILGYFSSKRFSNANIMRYDNAIRRLVYQGHLTFDGGDHQYWFNRYLAAGDYNPGTGRGTGGAASSQPLPKQQKSKQWRKRPATDELCNFFNSGHCARQNCPFKHACRQCSKAGHGETKCPSNKKK